MHKRRLLLILLIVVLFLASCTHTENSQSKFDNSGNTTVAPSPDTAQFHFIDVGQGDCIFIQNGDTTILIDAGTYESGHKIYEYLTNLKIDEIDYFIATHPHDDHIGGAESILRVIDVGTVFMGSEGDNSYAFENFVDVMLEKGITPTYPDMDSTYTEGDLSFRFLSPTKDFGNTNDNSFVVMVQYGEVKALFTGDAEKKVETDLISRGVDIRADILKVGHHGSRNASTSSFLNSVYPGVAVIQCGKDNSYGHPHEETLERLSETGCPVLRTDMEGDIILSTDGKTIIRSTGETYEITEKDETVTLTYIGNKKSKTFHIDSCPNLPGEKNRIKLSSREEAINSGYKPCGNCNP